MSGAVSYGIDFGTSTLLLCADDSGLPRIVNLSGLKGRPWVESVFALEGGQWLVGDEARRAGGETAFSLKARITASISEDPNQLDGEFHKPLKSLFEFFAHKAQELEDLDIRRAEVRIAVPVMWGRGKRELLTRAAKSAGYKNLHLTNVLEEPIAATAAWLRIRPMRAEELSLVFDCGGGTTDVAVLAQVTHGGESRIAVTATKGIALGGDFADLVVAELLLRRLLIQQPENQTLRQLIALISSARANYVAYPEVPTPLNRLYRAVLLRARQVKESSSSAPQQVSFAPEFPDLPKLEVSPADVDEVMKPLIRDLVKFAEGAVRESKWRMSKILDDRNGVVGSEDIEKVRMAPPSDILGKVNNVYLVGGMAHVRGFVEAFQDRFSNADVKVAPQPQQAIAEGLAPEPPYLGFAISNPGVDLLLSLDTGEELVCYEMFTPLNQVGDIYSGNNHAGVTREIVFGGPMVEAQVSLRLPSGKLVPIADELDSDGTPVQLRVLVGGGPDKPLLCKVYADGRIRIRDAEGKLHQPKLPWWPSAIGDFSIKVHAKQIEPPPLQPHRHK